MQKLNKRDKKFLSLLKKLDQQDLDERPDDYTYILDQITAIINGHA